MLNHNVRGRGAYHRCFQLGRELVARGHDVVVVTTSQSARIGVRTSTEHGVRLVEQPDLLAGRLRTGWDPWNTLRRIAWLRSRRFDLIHAFDSRPAVIWPALAAHRRHGTPLVIDWGDWWGRGGTASEREPRWLNALFAPIETFFEEHYKLGGHPLTVVSRMLRDRAVSLGVPADHITVIPNGADASTLQPQDRAEARARFGLLADAKILLFAAFALYDIRLVLDSFAVVRRAERRAVLVLAGERSRQVAAARAVLGGDAIVELGPLPRTSLATALAASDVCLLPLRDTIANRARYPVKFGDYIAAGRPVVANPVGDVSDAFRLGDIGELTDPSTEGFAAGILRLLKDDARRERCGATARALAEGRLSWRHCADVLEGVYRLALDE